MKNKRARNGARKEQWLPEDSEKTDVQETQSGDHKNRQLGCHNRIRRKPLGGVQDTMGNLPGEVNNRTINVKKEELAPSSRPVQLAKRN